VRVVAAGVPAGLGSAGDRRDRFDARLAFECMAIPSVKGVEIGLGFEAAARHGSQVHDPILPGGERGWTRPTNHAGGIEGGLTNGEPVCVTIAFKPIPTLRERLATVDAATGLAAPAGIVRSDVCAVPRAAIVAEAVVAFEVLAALLERTSAPVWSEVRANVVAWRARAKFPIAHTDWPDGSRT
jgi:chorismate synthase